MRDVIVVEGNPDGHRLEYVRFVVEAAQQAGSTVTLLTSATAVESEEFARELSAAVSAGLRVKAELRRRPTPLTFAQNWRVALRLAGRSQADLVVPGFDNYVSAAFVLTHGAAPRVRGLLMRPPATSRGAGDRIKRFFVQGLRRRGATIFELVSPFAQSSGMDALMDPSGLLDDPVEQTHDTEFRRELDAWALGGDGPIVGVFGALDERKCVIELIAAVSAHPRVRLIAVGRAGSPEYADRVLRAVSTTEDRVIHRFGPLSASDLSYAMNTTDAVALLYRNEVGSSGLLAHAIGHRKPVLGYRNATVAETVGAGIPGFIVPDVSTSSLGKAFDWLENPPASTESSTPGELRDHCATQWRAFAIGVDGE